MAGEVNCVYRFQGQGYRWSENYVLQHGTDWTQRILKATALAKLRFAMLGKGVRITGIRLSEIENPRRFKNVLHDGQNWPAAGELVATNAGSESNFEHPEVALHVRALLNNGRTIHKYLSGTQEKVYNSLAEGMAHVNIDAGFRQAYDKFVAALLNQAAGLEAQAVWGAMSLPFPSDATSHLITSAATDPDTGNMLLTISNTGPHSFAMGDKVQIYGNRRDPSAMPGINGTWALGTVTVGANTTTMVLLGTGDIDEQWFVQKSLGRVTKRVKGFSPFVEFEIQDARGKKRARASFFSEAGRG